MSGSPTVQGRRADAFRPSCVISIRSHPQAASPGSSPSTTAGACSLGVAWNACDTMIDRDPDQDRHAGLDRNDARDRARESRERDEVKKAALSTE